MIETTLQILTDTATRLSGTPHHIPPLNENTTLLTTTLNKIHNDLHQGRKAKTKVAEGGGGAGDNIGGLPGLWYTSVYGDVI